MERAWLAERLEAGVSIEAIAREVGRHPSTVSYWARKHGLTSSHAARHAARGPIERELLAEIVACRLSIRDMAEVFERSPTTIRRWLAKHGITPAPSARRGAGAIASAAETATPDLPCPTHGMTRHVPRADGSSAARAVAASKLPRGAAASSGMLVEEAGGCCALCGYDDVRRGASQLHHVDPASKSFALGRTGTRALVDAHARGGEEVRPPLLELPRSGRGQGYWRCPNMGRFPQQSGVAQWQSERLLTVRLWVRVPPPELDRGAAR